MNANRWRTGGIFAATLVAFGLLFLYSAVSTTSISDVEVRTRHLLYEARRNILRDAARSADSQTCPCPMDGNAPNAASASVTQSLRSEKTESDSRQYGQEPRSATATTDSAGTSYWLPLSDGVFGSQKPAASTRWWDGSPAYRKKLQDYALKHAQAIDPQSPLLPSDRKFVVFTATNDGMGNKLLPMVSTFAAALLWDRVFLVDWTGDDPFKPGHRWDRNPGSVTDFFESPVGSEWRYEVVAEALRDVVDLRAHETLVDMRTPDYRDNKLEWLCTNITSTYQSFQVVRIAGDQYFFPLMAANPLVKEAFSQYFAPGNMFGPIARFLLKPVPWIRDQVLGARSTFGPYTIGLQLRRLEGIGLKAGELDRVWQCAAHLRRVFGPDNESLVKFVVASDAPSSRDEAVARFGADAVISFPHTTNRNSVEGVRWALVEILTLSATNDIIATPHSTFGYSAHALGSLVPFRVENEPFTQCMRMFTPDPHAHFWAPLFNERTLRPDLNDRYCIDGDAAFFQTEGPPRWG